MKYLLNLVQALLFVVVGCCGTVLANNGREVRFEARSSSAGGGLRRLSRHDERRLMMSSKSMMSKSKMSSSSSRSERTDAPTADATMGGTEVPDISGSSRSKSKSMMSKSMMSKSKSSSSSRSQRTDAPTTGVTMDGTDGPSVRSRSSSKSKSMMSKSMMSKSKPSSRSQRTDAPTAGMTDGPVVTMNPTNAATDAPGQGDGDGPIVPPGDEAPVEETAAPTEALPTPPPTSPAGLGPPRPDDFECQENPQDYNVNIDVQIEYPDDEFAACDDEAQDSNINAVISDALNAAFPTTVSDWDGDALFGDFVFDGDQEVNNVDPFGGFRRKRYLRVFTRPSQIDDKRRRRLQEGTCPSRADVECTTDYCRWGCVTAATTDCGTSSLVNWPNLAEDIRAELAALGYDCLGIPDQLQVVLLVDDPEAPGAARSFSSNSLADNPEGEKVDENDNENPDENVNDNVNEDPNALLVNSEAEQDEAVNDATTATFSINSELDFEFFAGKGGRTPSQDEIDGLIRKTILFFTDLLSAPESDTAEDFLSFDMTEIESSYDDADPDAPKFTMNFSSLVEMKIGTAQTEHTIADIMGDASFRDFIGHYVWESKPWQRNEFHDTHAVHFKATGRGARLLSWWPFRHLF